MKIENHRLLSTSDDEIIEYSESPNQSENFKNNLPDTLVIHYTAGNSLESSVNWLKNPRSKASSHLVIGKNGKVVQLVPFDVIAWHAGSSSWKGRKRLNNYSIGIELDNAGLLEKRAEGFYTYFDKRVNNQKVVLAKHKHQNEEKAWEAYSEMQINCLEEICHVLKEYYAIRTIVGHDDIAPGRKVDPGPAFPMEKIKAKILYGRVDDDINENEMMPEETFKGIVTADYLNIRSKPGINSIKIADPLPRGTRVRILKEQGDWFYVNVDQEGWVHRNWVKTTSRAQSKM